MKRENVNNKTDIGTIVTMALTAKQESFCQLVAIQQYSLTDAYIAAYDTEGMQQNSIYQLSCRLSKQVKVTSRIEALKADISSKLASEVVWDKARIVSELSVNVNLGRETKQLAASNQALKLIGSAVGNVFEPDSVAVTVTGSVLHGLSNEVLDQLVAMGAEPVAIDDSQAIEAEYQLLDPETS